MKTIVRAGILLLVGLTLGCATPHMADRGRDAADVFTLGVGVGLGAKARVGPLVTGLLVDAPLVALRGGSLAASSWDGEGLTFSVTT